MNTGEALALVEEALAQVGFALDPDAEPPRFAGAVNVSGRRVRLFVSFPCFRFSRLPRVRLSHRAEDIADVVAHIEADDFVCYATAGSLILDHHRPAESALAVLREVQTTLERSLSPAADGEIRAEFPQHWRANANVHVALPPDAPEGMASVLVLPRLGIVPPLTVLTRRFPRGEFEGGAMGVLSGAKAGRAWIGRSSCDLRLFGGRPPDNFAEFLECVRAYDPDLALRLHIAAAEKFFSEPVRLFLLGPNGCVGVRLLLPLLWERAVRTKGYWAERMRNGTARVGVERLRGERMDAEYARGRNLPRKVTLEGKYVALIGCGAIGSQLARLLTQLGAGQGGGRLVLLDKDLLAAGNLGRHWLGAEHVGNCKAAAVAAELKGLSPGLAVQAIRDDAMRRLDLLCRTDLLVDATGEEPLSRALNHEVLLRRPGGPAMIFTWLLGQGAAAQALFVPAAPDGRGCYGCARPFGARPAVLSEDAPMLPAPAACGEAEFMPYGVASPVLAAGVAAAMALEWAGGEVRPSFRTIRIDHSTTRDGHDRDLPSVAGCPDCGTAGG